MLQFTSVQKSYGPIRALDVLTLAIQKGELFGLLGPNGAGKSTAVSLAVGLMAPDQGTVEIDGYGPPSDPEVRRQIGVAPQALALYDEMTGEENLDFFGRLQGLAGARLRERVQWGLDFVGLADRRKHRVAGYSGGMKRRLNLAAALLHSPSLILFDEPTAGVDPQSRNAIFDNILTLKRDGTTIVYTTHYMEEAQRLCDRVGIIDKGRLLALDTVEELIRAHGGPSMVFVERNGASERYPSEDPLATLAGLQTEGGLTRFGVERPDLETVFLNLTGRHLRDE